MEEQSKCPICGKTHKVQYTEWGTIFYCSEKHACTLYEYLFVGIDNITKERWLNAIYNYLEEHPYNEVAGYKYYWKFFYEETDQPPQDKCKINVYHLMKQYPYQVIDRLNRILLNLSRKLPFMSDTFNLLEIAQNDFRLFYCESADKINEVASIYSALNKLDWVELAYTDSAKNPNNYRYRISVGGWKHIAELTKKNETIKQGFIAMSFAPEAAYIENAFSEAIRHAQYEPQVIKNKEHNNYIVPEIFYEIKRSKFLVVDLTFPNYGAYYEAGYAQALGKEVIACCKKEVFDNPDTKPHFDIAQKSMIIWVDKQDLIDRLSKRIIATVN